MISSPGCHIGRNAAAAKRVNTVEDEPTTTSPLPDPSNCSARAHVILHPIDNAPERHAATGIVEQRAFGLQSRKLCAHEIEVEHAGQITG